MYGFDNWAAHRSTRRYLRHFLGLFVSRIVAGLRTPLLLIALESTLVCSYEAARLAGLLPAFCRSIQVKAPMLFSLSSFALSLLLVFRTNASYGRWAGCGSARQQETCLEYRTWAARLLWRSLSSPICRCPHTLSGAAAGASLLIFLPLALPHFLLPTCPPALLPPGLMRRGGCGA